MKKDVEAAEAASFLNAHRAISEVGCFFLGFII